MISKENAKIIGKDIKKGVCYTVTLDDGKSMPVSGKFKIPKDANGKEVVLERENGAIVRIIIDGVDCELNNTKPASQMKERSSCKNNNNNQLQNSHILIANAPYNFIPLNANVVKMYSNIQEVPSFDKFHEELKTGHIDIEIETKTPIYIRDTNGELKDDKECSDKNPDFFSPADKHRIPGSSLRGLIRNIVEIVSYGRFNFFEGDRKFHYRSFMDKSEDLRDAYVKQMIKSNGNVIEYPNLKAGCIRKNGHKKYEIMPSLFYRVEREVVDGIIKHDNNEKQFIKPISFNRQDVVEQQHKHHDVYIKYAKVTDICLKADECKENEGYLIRSGFVSGKHKDGTTSKKHLDWIIGKPSDDEKPIQLGEDIIDDYKNDINRSDKAIDLIKEIEKPENKEVPCFYITDKDNKVISIGHTGMFRLAYSHKLKDFTSNQKYENGSIDIPTAIFGNETDFAGRVFFEDAYIEENSKNKIANNAITPKILSGPKPTSFQLYLKQDKGSTGIKDYNSDPGSTEIRGYKMYWHKSVKNKEYIETDEEEIKKHKTQYTKIKPIESGAKFSGRIRFENLSEIELGALMFAIKLKNGLCHKIGMGKPLGFGSVKITPKLAVYDIKKRYNTLFAGWETEPSKDSAGSRDISDYIVLFDKYILKNIGETGKESLWDVDRLKDLEIMLDFDSKPPDDKTKYMELKEFKRSILPSPQDVIGERDNKLI